MALQISVAIESLSTEELLQISARLATEHASVRSRQSTVTTLLGIQNGIIRKGIFRLIAYGIPALLGVFLAAFVFDLGAALALFMVALMVWEALDFVAEISKYREL